MRTWCAGRSSKSPLARHSRTAIASERGAPVNPIVNVPGSMRTSRMPIELAICLGWAAAVNGNSHATVTSRNTAVFNFLPNEAQRQLHDARVGRRRDAEEVGAGHAAGREAE